MGIYGDLAGRSGTVDDLKEIRHGDGSGNLHEESTGIGDYNGDIFGLWNMNIFFHILGMSSSQLTNSIIFQRVGIPPTRIYLGV